MLSALSNTTDLVEELRLRRWARENYVAIDRRDEHWHPVVLDEMDRRDREAVDSGGYIQIASRIVPLVPDVGWRLHGAHHEPTRTTVLLKVPDLSVE